VENFDVIQLFPHTHKLDGLTGHRFDGEGGTASGIAVQFGQHHAVDVQGFVKGLRGIHSVLTDHRVHHQQDFAGVHRLLDGLEFCHQRLVYMEAAGGVQEDHVVAVLFGVLNGGLGNGDGIFLAHLEDRDVQLFPHHFQLLDGGGTIDVAGNQQRALAVLLAHETSQLGCVGGFTRALEAHHHHHRGGLGGDGNLRAVASHEVDQLLVDDFDNGLGGRQAFQHLRADGLFRDPFDEIFDHLVADVGFQQSQADLPHGLFDVCLTQTALVPQFFKRGGEFFG